MSSFLPKNLHQKTQWFSVFGIIIVFTIIGLFIFNSIEIDVRPKANGVLADDTFCKEILNQNGVPNFRVFECKIESKVKHCIMTCWAGCGLDCWDKEAGE